MSCVNQKIVFRGGDLNGDCQASVLLLSVVVGCSAAVGLRMLCFTAIIKLNKAAVAMLGAQDPCP